MEFLKSNLKQLLLTAAVYAAIGIYFVLRPDTVFMVIGRIIAVCLLAAGVLKTLFYVSEKNYAGIQRNTMTGGIIMMILGVFMLFRPEAAANFVGYILAFVIIVAGIMKLQYAVDIRHFGGSPAAAAVLGVIGIVLGAVALANPFSASAALLRMIGISMIVTAVSDIITAVNIYKCIKVMEDSAADTNIIDE